MENRANYALVGLFTLGVIASIFAFVWWFRVSNQAGERAEYRLIFTGSVSGLGKGGIVKFNGIRVGDVTEIEFVKDDPSRVSAVIKIDPKTPIRSDTRARLEYQGLTGVASIALTGGKGDAAPLKTPDGKGVSTIYAERSDFQDLLETAQRLSGKADSILNNVDSLLKDNQGQIGDTIKNIQVFSKALADNSPNVSAFLGAVGDMSQRISALSLKLEKLSTDADDLLRAVDPASINRTVSNIETFTQTVAENKANINSILADTASLAKRLTQTSVSLDIALNSFTDLTKAVDAQRINRSIEGISKLSDTLGARAGDVDTVLRNAADVSNKLTGTVDKVDRVLVAAESFLGIEGGANGLTKNMFSEITEAAKAFRALSLNLDKRTAEITAGFSKLSGPGLRDIQGLATDTRRTVNEANRTVRSLGRDPSQLLFGGQPSVPEYSGSR